MLTRHDFLTFDSELRVAVILSKIASSIRFVQRSNVESRPDLSATISDQDISFEVTSIQDPNLAIPGLTRESPADHDKVIQTFHSKILDKIEQSTGTNGPFVLVIDPHSDWDSRKLLAYIRSNLVSEIVPYSAISGLIVLYPEFLAVTFVTVQGIFISNSAASHTITGPAMTCVRKFFD